MLFEIFTALIGLIGLALIGFGLWMIFPPASLITVGIILLVWSYFVARARATQQQRKG